MAGLGAKAGGGGAAAGVGAGASSLGGIVTLTAAAALRGSRTIVRLEAATRKVLRSIPGLFLGVCFVAIRTNREGVR